MQEKYFAKQGLSWPRLLLPAPRMYYKALMRAAEIHWPVLFLLKLVSHNHGKGVGEINVNVKFRLILGQRVL